MEILNYLQERSYSTALQGENKFWLPKRLNTACIQLSPYQTGNSVGFFNYSLCAILFYVLQVHF